MFDDFSPRRRRRGAIRRALHNAPLALPLAIIAAFALIAAVAFGVYKAMAWWAP